MTEYTISCDTFHRLCGIIDHKDAELHPSWKTLRIDNGCAVVTDRKYMAIENIGGPSGIVHIIADPELVAQCEQEAKFSSRLTIVVNEMLKFAVAKTTFGYETKTNVFYADEIDQAWLRWRSIVMQCKEPATKPNGGMYWDSVKLTNLANSSPSAHVVFEQTIDVNRPALIRDVNDYNWLGVFNPYSSIMTYNNATLPTWMTEA